MVSKLKSLLVLVALIFMLAVPVWAAECDQYQCSKENQGEDEYLGCIKDKSQCLQDRIAETQTQAITLNNTISILNGQIQIQELQISQTLAEIEKLEREIEELTVRITGLEISLDRLSSLLVERVNANYKRHASMPLTLLLVSDSLGEFLSQYKYLQLTQQHLGGVMAKAEEQRLDYDQQKALKEDKQTEVVQKRQALESQQNQLTRQRSDQQVLLVETKHNESRYQAELAKTLAELQAIQSIIAGRGDETEVGSIAQGAKIATIIAGASPCSTGSHLHFEVVKDGAHRDPAGYLKNIDAVWNNDPDGAFGLSGGWDWPLDNPAKINQGYGMTYYARVRRAYGGSPHTGIDMFSKSAGNYTVKSVKDGTLSRGSIACGGGLLKYVKVEHKDDGIDTYYLHVNY